ncbi:MAG TPA: E3 binding domain-containing protein [Rubrobacteraceae bacterium]|nr:E3 binding domain-containing protein [Rubrobacteraceae bacterium]
MADERRGGPGTDPAEVWRQWYEVGSRMWADALRGSQESYLDPYGVYRQWFESMEALGKQMTAGVRSANGADRAVGNVDPAEVWRKWSDATLESWQKSAELSGEMMGMAPRWMEMLDQVRANLMSVEKFPKDPLELTVQWYNATSGPLSELVQDVIEREEFLEPASRWLQNYASLYKVFRDRSEEHLRSLQLPVRSDIARVAGLVVALEDKVDRIEEAFEDFEYGYAKPATAEEVGVLEERLDRVEGKLDRLLAALENGAANNGAADGAEERQVRATDAARRKAQELGVDLAEVDGTGAGGQITVEDVRRKGEI